MPRVRFSTNQSTERVYLKELLQERDWFIRHDFPVYLPRPSTVNREPSLSQRTRFQQQLARLTRQWQTIEPIFFRTVRTFRHTTVTRQYRCHVSRFGPEGKYRRPNQLFLRLRIRRDEQRAVETIGHELLHLMFKDWQEKIHLSYRQFEGLIDTLIIKTDLHQLFPSYTTQTIGRQPTTLLFKLVPPSQIRSKR